MPADRARSPPRACSSPSTPGSRRVAAAAIDAGAAILNDVSGLRDPELADGSPRGPARRSSSCTRAPTPKQVDFARYDGRRGRRRRALPARAHARWRSSRGVALEQLLLDPGPDFAKTPAESVEVLRALPRCTRSAGRSCCPSRASTSSARSPAARRASASPARSPRSLHGAAAGAAIVRVHDVARGRRRAARSGACSRASTERAGVRRRRRAAEVDPREALAFR